MRRAVLTFALRWLATFGLAVWVGGFTFYSAVVLPILHEDLGGLESGLITRRVSKTLNATGVAALLTCWAVAALDRKRGPKWLRTARWALLSLTTLALAGLIALHPVLENHLESGSLRNFYPLHQVYLIASTAQWGLNLVLIGAFVALGPDAGMTLGQTEAAARGESGRSAESNEPLPHPGARGSGSRDILAE